MRIEPNALRTYPLILRLFFWNQRRKYGSVLDAALIWGRVPKLFATVALLYGAIDRRRSPISPALRSLVTVRVSQLNGCRFCIDLNSSVLLKRGVSEDKVIQIATWRESADFSELERVSLEYAECVTLQPDQVGDELAGQLRDLLTENEIIELTALIAFQNMSAKFNSALGVPPQGFCQIPDH